MAGKRVDEKFLREAIRIASFPSSGLGTQEKWEAS